MLKFKDNVHLPQNVLCHMSLVMCHVSHVTCHMSCVTCHNKKYIFTYIYIYYFIFLVCWAGWWRVCYQWGLPRLVLKYKYFCKFIWTLGSTQMSKVKFAPIELLPFKPFPRSKTNSESCCNWKVYLINVLYLFTYYLNLF